MTCRHPSFLLMAEFSKWSMLKKPLKTVGTPYFIVTLTTHSHNSLVFSNPYPALSSIGFRIRTRM